MAQEPFDLSGLLQSLQGMDLSALLDTAGTLSGEQPADAQQQPPQADAGFQLPDPALLLKLTQLFSLLSSGETDPRTNLLLALRPLVHPEKQQRIDTAARMLQLVRILPQLRELGL